MSVSKANSTAALLVAVVLLGLLAMVQSQNYHYSNGWHPGKRDGAKDLRLSASVDDSCRIRPGFFTFINSLLKEEVARVQRSCFATDSINALKALWEPAATPLESKMEDGSQHKW